MPHQRPTADLTDQWVAPAEFAATAVVAAEQLHVKKRPSNRKTHHPKE